MISRARIAGLNTENAKLRIPYGGEQRALGELKALDVSFTAEEYSAIRQSLGGGKRGRLRARAIVPVMCFGCDCPLTHVERTGRAPYFSTANKASSHGPQCKVAAASLPLVQASNPIGEPSDSPLDPALAPRPQAENTTSACEEVDGSDYEEVDLESLEEIAPAPHYVIEDVSSPIANGAPSGHQALCSDACAMPAPHTKRLASARDLLILALNRAVAAGSTVRFCGQNFVICPAANVHHVDDGVHVAVYGRLTTAAWNQESGRLTLGAVPRTVQVWATGSVPRELLQGNVTHRVEPSVLDRPVPFIVFGKLKKLGPICGMPVFRSHHLLLLDPLALAARQGSAAQSSAPPVGAPEAMDLESGFSLRSEVH